MPYKTRKVKGKGTCVYKKETGKRVGCTTGPIKKYLNALHLNENIKKIIKEEINDFNWIEDIPSKKPMPSNWGSEEYHKVNDRIINEVFSKGLYYKGFNIGMDNFSGTVVWDNGEYNFVIYATPNWESENNIPINIEPYEYQYLVIRDVIELPYFEYEDQAKEWYEKIYPKKVYDQLALQNYVP